MNTKNESKSCYCKSFQIQLMNHNANLPERSLSPSANFTCKGADPYINHKHNPTNLLEHSLQFLKIYQSKMESNYSWRKTGWCTICCCQIKPTPGNVLWLSNARIALSASTDVAYFIKQQPEEKEAQLKCLDCMMYLLFSLLHQKPTFNLT